ncbi:MULTISPECIES: hypothetical protein [unclassified Nocardia]|uniref:hypothetical protein n=1 Tax=unclassified Nocardia TaxID=2637762 RepID=UPI00278C76FB|nr:MULTISPECIES: hypothetical protein [unclassified Nocardia]
MAFRAARLAIAITAAALIAACSQTDTPDAATSTPTTQTAASTTAAAVPSTATADKPVLDSPDQLRLRTCTELLEFFAASRDFAAELDDSSWTADEAAAEIIADGHELDEWTVWSSEQKAAWEAGIRDAATGSCS